MTATESRQLRPPQLRHAAEHQSNYKRLFRRLSAGARRIGSFLARLARMVPPFAWFLIAFTGLLVVAAVLLYADASDPESWFTSYFVRGETIMPAWAILVWDTTFFFVPCGIAVLLAGGIRERAPATLRILLPTLAAAAVFITMPLGNPAFFYTWRYVLLWLMPIWGTVAIVGTGRFRWTGPQQFGATLVFMAAWRPVYGGIPDFYEVFTAEGVLAPIPLRDLWEIFWRKFLHEILFVLIGLYLLYGRLPFVQKRPEWNRDFLRTVVQLQGGYRARWWVALGIGGLAMVAGLYADYLFRVILLRAAPVLGTGANDLDVYDNVTPELVLLLSLVAGAGEEIIFRGVIQTYLQRLFRAAFPSVTALAFPLALFFQALLFGLVHSGYYNLLHVFGPFMFGLFMGVVFRYFGLLAAIYAHVAIDIIAFGVSAIDDYAWMGLALDSFLLLNVFGGGITVIYLLLDRFVFRPLSRIEQAVVESPAPKP